MERLACGTQCFCTTRNRKEGKGKDPGGGNWNGPAPGYHRGPVIFTALSRLRVSRGFWPSPSPLLPLHGNAFLKRPSTFWCVNSPLPQADRSSRLRRGIVLACMIGQEVSELVVIANLQ